MKRSTKNVPSPPRASSCFSLVPRCLCRPRTLNFLATVIGRHLRSIGSRWRKLTPEKQALLVLAYLKRDLPGPGHGVRHRDGHGLAVRERGGGDTHYHGRDPDDSAVNETTCAIGTAAAVIGTAATVIVNPVARIGSGAVIQHRMTCGYGLGIWIVVIRDVPDRGQRSVSRP